MSTGISPLAFETTYEIQNADPRKVLEGLFTPSFRDALERAARSVNEPVAYEKTTPIDPADDSDWISEDDAVSEEGEESEESSDAVANETDGELATSISDEIVASLVGPDGEEPEFVGGQVTFVVEGAAVSVAVAEDVDGDALVSVRFESVAALAEQALDEQGVPPLAQPPLNAIPGLPVDASNPALALSQANPALADPLANGPAILNPGTAPTATTAITDPALPEVVVDPDANQTPSQGDTPDQSSQGQTDRQGSSLLNTNAAPTGTAAVPLPAGLTAAPAVDPTATVSVSTPSPNAPAAPASAALPTVADTTLPDEALNAARLERGLSSVVNQKGGAMTLRLTPPEMGTVRIQLQMVGTAVTAQLHAETESARALLTQQLSQLRGSLESQGLTVERLSVQSLGSTNSSSLQQQNDPPADQQSQNPESNSRDSDERSGGRFNSQQQQQQRQFQQRDPHGRNDFRTNPADFASVIDTQPASVASETAA